MNISLKIVELMARAGKKVKDELRVSTSNPKLEQERVLKKLINKNKNTKFGKEYHFDEIHSISDFQRLVPLGDYDFFAPYIEEMAKGKKNILTCEKIVHFNETSGTLGNPKMIPITKSHVKLFSKYNAKYINYLPSIKHGFDWANHKGFSLTEGACRRLPTGVTFGCASSYMAIKMGKMIPFLNIDFMSSMYSSPKEARIPKKGTPTRYLHSLFALKDNSISYINVTFSSYLLEIFRYIEDNWKSLVNDIRTGKTNVLVDMPDDIRKSVNSKLKADPKRADELEKIFKEGFDNTIANKIWPNLRFVICVGGAGFEIYTNKMKKRYLSSNIDFVFLGLSSSEAMFSVPFEINNENSVFIPDGVFMEFIDCDNPESIKLLHELEIGKSYEVVVTNLSGLYRYKMKDIIKVTGVFKNTPTMKFLNRTGFSINMYAEKTSEMALLYSVIDSVDELNIDLYDYAFYPDSDSTPGHYICLLELRDYSKAIDKKALRDKIEENLFKYNPIYKEVVEDHSCGPLEIRFLQNETFLLYRDLMMFKGRSAAQLKPIHLLDTPFLQKFFFTFEEKFF